MFARVALLSAIGMASVLVFTPLQVRADGHGHANEVNYKAYVDECNKMDHASQAYTDCIDLAEGQ